jgi:hypothetical protein
MCDEVIGGPRRERSERYFADGMTETYMLRGRARARRAVSAREEGSGMSETCRRVAHERALLQQGGTERKCDAEKW